MGRPPTKPKRFKDGFYIEVRNKGANAGMKIHFDTEHDMKDAAIMYGTNKEVVILGEHKRDRWLNLEPAAEEQRVKKMRLDRPREVPNKYVRGAKPARAAEPAKKAEAPAKPAKKEKPAKPAKKAVAAKPAKKEKPVKPAKKAVAAKPAKKAKPVAKKAAKKKK